MRRRTVLGLLTSGMGFAAGCSSRPGAGADSTSAPPTDTHTDSPGPTETPAPTEPPPKTATATPRENPDTVFVDAENGSVRGPGTKDDPMVSIQSALQRAVPGDTIEVAPGTYKETVQPPRPGKPGEPITITGPPDAVLKSDPREYSVVLIRHSHIHITGLTIDGLEQPDSPDKPDSYSRAQLVQARPPTRTDEYLENIVVSPHGIGNTQSALVSLERTRNSEVGPFRVIGPGGADYVVGDAKEELNGEIVYIGTSPTNLGTNWHPWTEYDRSRNIHIHHIDNSQGHGHSEIVNTKLGTHDVLVEYCTDAGGSQNSHADSAAASVRLQSYDATVRWCDLRNGSGHGVEVGSYKARNHQQEKPESELTEEERLGGLRNSIYRNRVEGFDDNAFWFPLKEAGQTPEEQTVYCGNTYDGTADGNPGKSCSTDIPEGDGIGHTGGDSPWN